MILYTIVAIACVVIAAALLAAGQAFALDRETYRWPILATTCVVAGSILGLPVFYSLGFHVEFPPAHHADVGWTAIGLAPLTTMVSAVLAANLYREELAAARLSRRMRLLVPFHLAVLVLLGCGDLAVLTFIFLGNIH